MDDECFNIIDNNILKHLFGILVSKKNFQLYAFCFSGQNGSRKTKSSENIIFFSCNICAVLVTVQLADSFFRSRHQTRQIRSGSGICSLF